jgi:ketosteroid isomerase-like protein
VSDVETVRRAVVERLHAYAWALDDRDWRALAACFTDDAIADYGASIGIFHGADAIVELCRRVLAPLDASQHVLANHQVTMAGDGAEARCHVVAQHTRAAAAGGANYTLGGTYRATLAHIGDAWRIHRFALDVRWGEGNPAVLERA